MLVYRALRSLDFVRRKKIQLMQPETQYTDFLFADNLCNKGTDNLY